MSVGDLIINACIVGMGVWAVAQWLWHDYVKSPARPSGPERSRQEPHGH